MQQTGRLQDFWYERQQCAALCSPTGKSWSFDRFTEAHSKTNYKFKYLAWPTFVDFHTRSQWICWIIKTSHLCRWLLQGDTKLQYNCCWNGMPISTIGPRQGPPLCSWQLKIGVSSIWSFSPDPRVAGLISFGHSHDPLQPCRGRQITSKGQSGPHDGEGERQCISSVDRGFQRTSRSNQGHGQGSHQAKNEVNMLARSSGRSWNNFVTFFRQPNSEGVIPATAASRNQHVLVFMFLKKQGAA